MRLIDVHISTKGGESDATPLPWSGMIGCDHEQFVRDLRRLNELAVQEIAAQSDIRAILQKIMKLARRTDAQAQDDEQSIP